MLSKRLRELRQTKDLTQKEFAKLFNMSDARYNQYETGKRKPDYETLLQFARFFNVSIDYLLGNTDDPRTTDDILREAGLKRDLKRGLTKDQLPKELQDLGVKYIQLAKEMQDEELDPEDVKKLIEIIKKHKK